jgi:hypothetical protein
VPNCLGPYPIKYIEPQSVICYEAFAGIFEVEALNKGVARENLIFILAKCRSFPSMMVFQI